MADITLSSSVQHWQKVAAGAEHAYGRLEGETDMQLIKRALINHSRSLVRAKKEFDDRPNEQALQSAADTEANSLNIS